MNTYIQNPAPISYIPPESPRRGVTALRLFVALVAVAMGIFAVEYIASPIMITRPTQQVAAAAVEYDAFATTTLQAKSAIVVDLSTRKVLYSLRPNTQLPLASLTKVPLALVVSEVLAPDTIITIPYTTTPMSKASQLMQGDRWRVRDLITYTLVASSNDGAEILAQAAAPEFRSRYPEAPAESTTIWRMNSFAQSLGLTHSYFLNPSGLDESTTQSGAYGSAGDVAKLFAYAASTSPGLFAGTARGGLNLTSIDGRTVSVINTDEALDDLPDIIMGKTGYTDLSGGNLAIVFDAAPGKRIVAVVLGSTKNGRFEDMKKLVAQTRETLAHEVIPNP